MVCGKIQEEYLMRIEDQDNKDKEKEEKEIRVHKIKHKLFLLELEEMELIKSFQVPLPDKETDITQLEFW